MYKKKKISQLLFNCNIEKIKVMIFYVNLSISPFINTMYFLFLIFANTSHNHQLSETLGKSSKYQNL